MITFDINQLLQRAEQAFLAGQLDFARADLAKARQAAGDHPAILHLTALVEKTGGNAVAAKEAFVAALRLAPKDPQINSNYANLLVMQGESESALFHYNYAITADPGLLDARFNRAMLLQKLGRFDEALADINTLLAARPGEARVHSAHGSLLRAADRLAEAGKAFDRALSLDPKRPVALHGRARVAMERGEDQASDHYRNALALSPTDRDLLLGYAEALEAEGSAGDALSTLSNAVEVDPTWIEGQTILARMRWEAGEGRAFTRGLETATAAQKGNVQLWRALASTLAGADFFAEAAEAAKAGLRAVDGDPELQLLEAACASKAGQLDLADRLFAAFPHDVPMRQLSEAQHSIRRQRFDEASTLLEEARTEQPWDVATWAMTSLAWRLTTDPRNDWLNNQPGLVALAELELEPGDIVGVAERLRGLHRTRAHPIHQSLRGGTQTRGRLFERSDPEIRRFAESIGRAVNHYWSELPSADPTHPLLRHQSSRPRIAGSWSVRLTGGGFHVAHFHPRGILSSAAYLVVPEPSVAMEGWLEIGAPPADLGVPLEPLRRVEPSPGRLALFPSYMFHGTRPFSTGERLTVAFDVVVA